MKTQIIPYIDKSFTCLVPKKTVPGQAIKSLMIVFIVPMVFLLASCIAYVQTPRHDRDRDNIERHDHDEHHRDNDHRDHDDDHDNRHQD